MKNINAKEYIFSEELCESIILNMFLGKLYKNILMLNLELYQIMANNLF